MLDDSCESRHIRRESGWKGEQSVLNIMPEAVGPRLATFGGGAIYSVREPGSQTLETGLHLAAVMLAPAPGNWAAFGSGKMQEYDAPVGAFVLQPANVEGRAVWSCTRESVIIGIKPEHLLELAASEHDIDHVRLRPPPFGTIDLRALNIAQQLKAELTAGTPPNELFVDSLITILGIHILRNYAGGRKLQAKGGLSAHRAKKVQEYMAENLKNKISVAELAATCDLSPNHFINAFTKTFGVSPHKHLINLRLDFAETLIMESELPFDRIAFMSGFSSHAHLTSTMSKYRHRTPAAIRLSR